MPASHHHQDPPRSIDNEVAGRVLGGRYRLLAAIGEGSSSRVFLAEDLSLGRQVAVKRLRVGLSDDPRFRRRFRAEAQAAAQLSHPNLLTVHDWGEDPTAYLVTEVLLGGSLLDMIERGPALLTPSQGLLVALQVARGLSYAHQLGWVHRDIKPGNLLFGEEGRLRIADFGIARAIAESTWTDPGGVLIGTARYAAPEQADGDPVDGRADAYSLAVTILEAVTGRVPLVGETAVATLRLRQDQDLDGFGPLGALGEALRPAGRADPALRPSTTELVESLTAAARSLPRPERLPLIPVTELDDRPRGDPTVQPVSPPPIIPIPRPPAGEDPVVDLGLDTWRLADLDLLAGRSSGVGADLDEDLVAAEGLKSQVIQRPSHTHGPFGAPPEVIGSWPAPELTVLGDEHGRDRSSASTDWPPPPMPDHDQDGDGPDDDDGVDVIGAAGQPLAGPAALAEPAELNRHSGLDPDLDLDALERAPSAPSWLDHSKLDPSTAGWSDAGAGGPWSEPRWHPLDDRRYESTVEPDGTAHPADSADPADPDRIADTDRLAGTDQVADTARPADPDRQVDPVHPTVAADPFAEIVVEIDTGDGLVIAAPGDDTLATASPPWPPPHEGDGSVEPPPAWLPQRDLDGSSPAAPAWPAPLPAPVDRSPFAEPERPPSTEPEPTIPPRSDGRSMFELAERRTDDPATGPAPEADDSGRRRPRARVRGSETPRPVRLTRLSGDTGEQPTTPVAAASIRLQSARLGEAPDPAWTGPTTGSRRRWLVSALVVVLIAVVAGVVAYYLTGTGLPGETAETETSVSAVTSEAGDTAGPATVGDYIGGPVGDVEVDALRNNWQLSMTERPENDLAPGLVVDQEPGPGVELAEGERLTIVVSVAPDPGDAVLPDADADTADGDTADADDGDVTEPSEGGAAEGTDDRGSVEPLPDLVGRSGEEAAELAAELGLSVSEASAHSDRYEAGVVVDTDPPVGAMVAPGDEVTIVVSSGARRGEVPDVVGLDVTDAVAALERAGFVAGTITGPDDGVVVSTAPAEGEIHRRTSPVDLRTEPAP